jgi:hypothetical protein
MTDDLNRRILIRYLFPALMLLVSVFLLLEGLPKTCENCPEVSFWLYPPPALNAFRALNAPTVFVLTLLSLKARGAYDWDAYFFPALAAAIPFWISVGYLLSRIDPHGKRAPGWVRFFVAGVLAGLFWFGVALFFIFRADRLFALGLMAWGLITSLLAIAPYQSSIAKH